MIFKTEESTKSRATSPARRFLQLGLILLLLGISVASVSFTPISNYDIFRNLTVGKWIQENRAIPREEFFSFTESQRPWTDYEWLSELVFWRVHDLAAFDGLVLYKSILIWLSALFLFFVFRDRTASAGGAPFVLALVPALVLSRARFLVRPHIHSFVLASALVWWLSGEHKRKASGVFVLFVLWANLHSGHLGFLILGLAILAGLVKKNRLRLIAAAVLGMLVNPYTWKISLPLIHILSAQNPSKLLVAEWASLGVSSMPWFWVYVVCSGALLFIGGRKGRRWDTLVLVVFAMLTAKSVRMAPYLLLLSVPGNAEALWLAGKRFPRRAFSSAVGSVAVVSVGLLLFFNLPLSGGVNLHLYPEAAASYVLDNGLQLRCFNDMHQGSYLTWRWFPPHTVYMDGRTELFVDLASMERAACEDVSSWNALMEGFEITGAVLDYPKMWQGSATATMYPLFRFLGWKVVAWDDGGTLLLKPGGERDSLITRDGYQVLDPFLMDQDPQRFTPEERGLFLSEAERSVASEPNSVRALYVLSNYHSRSNRPASALTSYEKIMTIDPEDHDIHARMALALEKLGLRENSRKEWKRQLSQGLDKGLVCYHIGRVSLMMGDKKSAVKWLKKAIRNDPDQKTWNMLLTRALSVDPSGLSLEIEAIEQNARKLDRKAAQLMNQGGFVEAEKLLLQATASAPWLSQAHQNLGASLANQERWVEAEVELREALAQNPSLGWARYNLAGLMATGKSDTLAALSELDTLLSSKPDSTLRLMANSFLLELQTSIQDPGQNARPSPQY